MCAGDEVKGHSTREIREGFKLFYTGSEKKNGVGIILDEELKKQVIKSKEYQIDY